MAKNTSGATRQIVTSLPPDKIHVEEGFNHRDFRTQENLDHLARIKAQIKEHGVKRPLIVRWDGGKKKYFLIDGECRLRGVNELVAEGEPILEIPVTEEVSIGQADRIILSLISNDGKPPAPWEIGGAFKRLKAFGLTVEDIAQKVAMPVAAVKQAIKLSSADAETKRLLNARAVTTAAAEWALDNHGDDAGEVLKKEVKKAEKKHTEKKEAKATEDTGKKKPGRKPSKDKPEPVKRPKAKGGRFIKDDVLALVTKALESAEKSDDVEIQLAAESALEALNGKE